VAGIKNFSRVEELFFLQTHGTGLWAEITTDSALKYDII